MQVSVRQRTRVVVGAMILLVVAGAWAQDKNVQVNYRELEADIQQRNAARIDHGGRIAIFGLGDGVVQDRRTTPESVVDGNVHSRQEMTGVPYSFRIDLVDKLPVDEINFICSDYAGDTTPADIEVRLSDGTALKKTLTTERPEKGAKGALPRQTVPVNKDLEWVEVTVLSLHPGAVNPKTGKAVNWGGIGEIEVLTSADLQPYLVVPDHNPAAPAYVRAAMPRNDYTDVKVTLPEPIPLGQSPGIYLSRDELVRMRDDIARCDRATNMMARLTESCGQWAAEAVVMPDPNIPAQMKDRGDAQAKAHDLLAKKAGWLGWAYQLMDQNSYAEKAREILLGYARLYPNDYKEHKGVHGGDTSKVMAQRLSEAMWILPLIQAYDLVRSAPCMTESDRTLIEKDLIREAITFINQKKSAAETVAQRDQKNPDWRTAPPEKNSRGGAIGNWMNFYNAAYIQGGVVLGDKDWIDLGVANTRWMIANGITADGMWGEGAIGYQMFARHALVACMEAAARKGYDLWSFDGCKFKNLFDSAVKYAYPDGTSPGINDSGRASVGAGWYAMAYDFAYLRYGDPNYGAVVNGAPRQLFQSSGCYFPTVIYKPLPEKPLEGLSSLVFDSLGYAILRGQESGEDTFMLMDYGAHGGAHGHPDKLNLVLFADGDELAGEPQSFRYEDSRHGSWTTESVAHWTLSVDKHSQVACGGKLMGFYDAGDVKIMRGEADAAYAGVILDRTVVQMPGYIVDVFRGAGPARHTYDYPLCFRGNLDSLAGIDLGALKPLGLETQRGYKHIMVTAPAATDENWSATWQREASLPDANAETTDGQHGGPANRVDVTVLGQAGTTVHCGIVPGDRQQAVLRREGKDAVFAAVIDPYLGLDVVKSVEPLAVSGPVKAQGVKVTRRDGGTDLIVVRFDPQTDGKLAGASTFGDGSSDALVSVVRLDPEGKVIRLGVLGGTQLAWKEDRLNSDSPDIAFK